MKHPDIHATATNTARVGRRAAICTTAIGIALSAACSVGTAFAQSSARAVPAAEWTKIIAAARKEGKVVVYTTTAPAVHARIKAQGRSIKVPVVAAS